MLHFGGQTLVRGLVLREARAADLLAVGVAELPGQLRVGELGQLERVPRHRVVALEVDGQRR